MSFLRWQWWLTLSGTGIKMTKIALISKTDVLRIWSLPNNETEVAQRYELPDGNQLSPIKAGWTNGEYSVLLVTEFIVPDGYIISGPPSYLINEADVVESYETAVAPVVRPTIKKSIVQARLIAAGKMPAAYTALTSNPIYFARWFAPDRPVLYLDDPDALILLKAIGADPAVILAPEEPE